MRLSERFEGMRRSCEGSDITLRRLLPGLGPSEHGFVTLLVAVCFLHPVPMPGLSWGLAAIVTVGGARLIRGQGLWLPASVLDRPIPAKLPGRLFGWAGRIFRRTERFIRPRGGRVVNHPWMRRANGVAVLLCGLMFFAPLPVPTNYPPAIALLLLSLGMLEGDLLFLALGYAATAAGVAFFAAIAVYGWSGLRLLLGR